MLPVTPTPSLTISSSPGPGESGKKRQSQVVHHDHIRIFTKLGMLHGDGAKRLLSEEVRYKQKPSSILVTRAVYPGCRDAY